mmetsp:Transcript_19765/g.29237  ORF Transcript_19765/g.29237 Transcript_19765/m.29237 type:complete len:187 (-) Transcript_19765:812-1372(-)
MMPPYATILMATRYYVAGDRDTWKPVILTAMSIGVAGFPDPDKFKEVEEIANVTKRNTHAFLCPATSVDPTTRKAVPFLKKEVIRRAITNKVKPVPRISSWNQKNVRNGYRTIFPTALTTNTSVHATANCLMNFVNIICSSRDLRKRTCSVFFERLNAFCTKTCDTNSSHGTISCQGIKLMAVTLL